MRRTKAHVLLTSACWDSRGTRSVQLSQWSYSARPYRASCTLLSTVLYMYVYNYIG